MPKFGAIQANEDFVISGKAGKATLTLGTVTVSDTGVTANSVIIITPQVAGVITGIVRISAINPGVGFTILSTNLTDGAQIGWLRIEP